MCPKFAFCKKKDNKWTLPWPEVSPGHGMDPRVSWRRLLLWSVCLYQHQSQHSNKYIWREDMISITMLSVCIILLAIYKVNLRSPHLGLCPGWPGVVGEHVTLLTPAHQALRKVKKNWKNLELFQIRGGGVQGVFPKYQLKNFCR